MKKDVKKNMFIPQFEFSEDTIDEMVAAAKKEYVGEMVSGLGLSEDVKSVISEVFCIGVSVGICDTLEAINSIAASSNEDSVLNVSFDAEPIS